MSKLLEDILKVSNDRYIGKFLIEDAVIGGLPFIKFEISGIENPYMVSHDVFNEVGIEEVLKTMDKGKAQRDTYPCFFYYEQLLGDSKQAQLAAEQAVKMVKFMIDSKFQKKDGASLAFIASFADNIINKLDKWDDLNQDEQNEVGDFCKLAVFMGNNERIKAFQMDLVTEGN